MTQQYLRKASLLLELVNDKTGNAVLDLSNMQFTFQTQAYYLGTPKSVQLRVYNLSAETAKQVTKEGSQVFLSAGYEGNFDQIFQGLIVQARIGRNGTDSYLDITAVDGDYIYNNKLISTTIAAGTNALGRLGAISTAAGIKTGVLPKTASGAQLHRGKTIFGLARDHLTYLCGTIGANWTIENGVLDVIPQNAYKEDGTFPELNYLTGMVGVPEQMELGIAIKVLLNPSIGVNKKVKLDNASIQQYQFPIDIGQTAGAEFVPPIAADGMYKVLYVTHTGDTRGNEWFTDIVCYAGDNLINTSQLPFQRIIT